MPRKQKEFNFIYKTTCKISNRYYVGMHSTNKIDDGYFGSGRRLHYSIKKHGLENHTREILEFLPDNLSLKEREKEIVNSEMLNDTLCMNLRIGGEGGGGFVNDEHKQKFLEAGTKASAISGKCKENIKTLWINDKEWADKTRKNMSHGLIERWQKIPKTQPKHSEETKLKMRKPKTTHKKRPPMSPEQKLAIGNSEAHIKK